MSKPAHNNAQRERELVSELNLWRKKLRDNRAVAEREVDLKVAEMQGRFANDVIVTARSRMLNGVTTPQDYRVAPARVA